MVLTKNPAPPGNQVSQLSNTVTSYEYIGDRLVNMSINNGTSVTSLGFVYDCCFKDIL